MTCGRSTAKCFMLVENAFFVVIGIALSGLGGYIRVSSKDYDSVVGAHGIATPANLLIAAGVVIFLVAFLGCLGAIKESKCILGLYIFAVALILLVEIGGVAAAFYFKAETEELVTKGITEAVSKNYGQKGNETLTEAVNDIQRRFKCCGAKSSLDWKYSQWANDTGATLPSSCFDDQGFNTTAQGGYVFKLHKESCIDAVKKWASENLVIIGGVGAGVLLIEILGIVFATVLFKRTDPVGVV